MKSLMKMDFWLMRWALLFFLFLAPLSGILGEAETSMTGILLVFVMSLALTQMDEKQNTRRFMLSLPIPLKAFFQARTIFVTFIGIAFLVLESIGQLISSSNMTMNEMLIHMITQFAIMLILAPIAVAMFTLLKHPALKWGLTFVIYIIIIIIGTIISLFITGLTSYLGALAYLIAFGLLILSSVLGWLILMAANKIRAGMDLV